MKKLLAALAAAAALVACGQKPEPVSNTPAATTPSSEAPAPSTTPPTTAELQQAATTAQESAGAVEAPAAGEDALSRAVAMPESAQLPGGRWKAGTHYQAIVPAQGTNVEPGQVEVIEFMWFACGACYQLNERVVAWKAKLPPYVKFRQEHVMWGPAYRGLAKLLYTLEVLGKPELVGKAFNEIHVAQRNLVSANDAQTEALQVAFAKANGIPEADFKREYNGFAVQTRLKRAEELTRRYRVEKTPTFIVNGKYVAEPSSAGGGQQLIELINDLIAAEKR